MAHADVEPLLEPRDVRVCHSGYGRGPKDSTLMRDQGTTLSAEDVTLLLPWHGAGTLSPALARQIDAKLIRDATLKRAMAGIKRERDVIVALNESLGLPSPRVLASVFAAIDAATVADKIFA